MLASLISVWSWISNIPVRGFTGDGMQAVSLCTCSSTEYCVFRIQLFWLATDSAVLKSVLEIPTREAAGSTLQGQQSDWCSACCSAPHV